MHPKQVVNPNAIAWALCVVHMLASCDNTEEWIFPEGFLFGAAIAGFQAEMGCPTLDKSECDDPNSDWYQFATSAEMIADQSCYLSGQNPSEVGPGFWELYESDLDLAATQLNHNTFRMSIEWSRIFLQPTDGIEGYDALKAVANAEALAKYYAIFEALHSRNIKPLVTLNHYSLPTWIHDTIACHRSLSTCVLRGWLDKQRIVNEISKYAGFVAREFGAQVDLWATLNEPMAVVIPGFVSPSESRANPPSLFFKFSEARTALNAMIDAHARMYDAVKAADVEDADNDGKAAQVGVVYNMIATQANNPKNEVDIVAAKNIFYLWNLVYLNATCLGVWDENWDGQPVERPDLKNRMDYLGINYYNQWSIVGTQSAFLPELSPLTTYNPLESQTDLIYPKGIYEVTLYAHKNFAVPIYITENGTGAREGQPHFQDQYLVDHFRWLLRAVSQGAEVRGYYYWTLVDNFEWNHGMKQVFGLYGIDPGDPTKSRFMRDVATTYSSIAKQGAIPNDLLSAYPEQ